jgi:putative tryptophan/tyrosine transport system substrate-binding protein
MVVHRELIFALAARYRLPAVYPFRFFAAGGELASYGLDPIEQYISPTLLATADEVIE